MFRRIAEARPNSCYIDVFRLIFDHKVDDTVNKNGIFFNMPPLSDEVVRQIDDIIKRCEQQHQTNTVASCVLPQ